LLVLVVALTNTRITVNASLRTATDLVHQKANEAELANIQDRLNEFYGPYLQRSEENRRLAEELKSLQPEPATFRLLLALQDEGWRSSLAGTDRTLVDEIVANGEALRDLLRSKAGLAEAGLQDLFAQAATHFTFLSLSNAGRLNDPSRFVPYVYPRQLDGALRAAIERLEARAVLLRAEPAKSHGTALTLRGAEQAPATN
jgi:hypothetical protein